MRPKLLALFAVSALALSGCASAEPSTEPTATVMTTATPSPVAKKTAEPQRSKSAKESYDPGNLEDVAKLSFYRQARVRAPMAGDHTKIDQEKYAKALEDYCSEGKEFTVSKVKAFNKQLADNADLTFCPMIEEQLNSR